MTPVSLLYAGYKNVVPLKMSRDLWPFVALRVAILHTFIYGAEFCSLNECNTIDPGTLN
jgi:hypothetical protein